MRLDHLLSMENVVEIERYFTVFDERIPRKTVVQFSGTNAKKQPIVGLSNAEGPPVPIPNTEVKLCSAENTSLETMREDRSRPTSELLERAVPNPIRGCSSAGRAPALQAGGHGFESHHLHQRKRFRNKWKRQPYRLIAQQVRARA